MQLRWALSLAILALLTGMLMSTTATAALAFPTVKKLGVLVPAWPGDPQAWLLVAGLPMQNAFIINDRVAALGVLIAGFLTWPRQGEKRSGATLGAWVALAGLVLIVGAEFALHGHMAGVLQEIQNANNAGLSAIAAEKHAAFSKLHPFATAFMGFRLLLLLIGFLSMMLVVAPQPRRVASTPL